MENLNKQKKSGSVVISYRLNLSNDKDKIIYRFLNQFDRQLRGSIVRKILYETVVRLNKENNSGTNVSLRTQ